MRYNETNRNNARLTRLPLVLLFVFLWSYSASPQDYDPSEWKAYASNTICLDWTWCITDGMTKDISADLMLENLARMAKTDNEPWANQHRFTCTVTNEMLFFLEKYPEKREELIKRIKEGRIMISPFLCNSLWGFQGIETFLRSMYPAKRLANEAGVQLNAGVHSELPSLPWGVAPLLAGSGIHWCSVPFLNFDTKFAQLTNPPLFKMEGPDGSKVNIVLDRWACLHHGYYQTRPVFRQNNYGYLVDCIKHYSGLKGYPCKFFLMDGSHSDLNPVNIPQVKEFSEKIIRYNKTRSNSPELVDATFAMFCKAVDSVEATTPFMPTIKGGFGHSWELWPAGLAKYAASFRENERRQVCIESLMSASGAQISNAAFSLQEKIDYDLAMMNDHAWNECKNLRINAFLRKDLAYRLSSNNDEFLEEAWRLAGLEVEAGAITVFNPSNFARKDIAKYKLQDGHTPVGVKIGNKTTPSQLIQENGDTILYFIIPEIAGYGFETAKIIQSKKQQLNTDGLKVGENVLENSYYRLTFNPESKQVESLIFKPTGKEYVAKDRPMVTFNYHVDKEDIHFTPYQIEVVAKGPAIARLKITGEAGRAEISYSVSLYAGIGRIDIDVGVLKEPIQVPERLEMRLFMNIPGSSLHVETPGAVIVPGLAPGGTLQPGADLNRFATYGFVDVCGNDGEGFICTSLDAFCLRRDLPGTLNFELLGNDMNIHESVKDQNGEKSFRFRFSLGAYSGEYSNKRCFEFSRGTIYPLMSKGGILKGNAKQVPVSVEKGEAVATAFKPASPSFGEGFILRLWKTAGEAGPLVINVNEFMKAVLCDLLENDIRQLEIKDGKVEVDVKPYGFAAIRLLK